MNRTDRLHAVHEALRRARPRGVTAAQLAEQLEVSIRTIKRDVSALQQGGAPIWAQPGPGGGYVLDASADLPAVAFTPSQAVALVVALAVLPDGSPFSVDASSAIDKVLDTLEPPARERAENIAARVWVLGSDRSGAVSPSVLRAVERSLTDRVALTIDYERDDGTATRRTVEPVIAARGPDRWFVVAHCRRRDDIRWFRTDRIRQAWLTKEHYELRPVSAVGTPPPTAHPVTR